VSAEQGVYRHFKGGRYLVVATARLADGPREGEEAVVYAPLYRQPDGEAASLWVRSLASWDEPAPSGEARFERVEEPAPGGRRRFMSRPTVVEAERNDTGAPVEVATLHGAVTCAPGDWIVHGPVDSWPVEASLFERKYVAVDAE
jgi:hypothetical protein